MTLSNRSIAALILVLTTACASDDRVPPDEVPVAVVISVAWDVLPRPEGEDDNDWVMGMEFDNAITLRHCSVLDELEPTKFVRWIKRGSDPSPPAALVLVQYEDGGTFSILGDHLRGHFLMDEDGTAAVSRTFDKHTILYDVTPFSDAPITLGQEDLEFANQTVETSYSIDHESTA
ncbi:MAG: hypothetical protein ACI8PZ_007260, partial [Myxococcota bacterium]